MWVYRHADTHKLALVRCRGVRRMHLNSNMSALSQEAPAFDGTIKENLVFEKKVLEEQMLKH